jgi:hypothetical protein
MVAASGTTKYTYYAGGLLWTEGGPWASDTVTNYYITARMRVGLGLAQPTGTWTNGFTYGEVSERITWGGQTGKDPGI